MRWLCALGLCTCLLPQLTYGKSYDLEIKKQKVAITGKAVEAITINGSIPGPTLYFKEGEDAEIRVKNSMDEVTSLHWHGILLDGKMDGVPGLNGFHGIAPGETFIYRFKIRQSGTYWYHSHYNLQEQRGMYGALVIDGLSYPEPTPSHPKPQSSHPEPVEGCGQAKTSSCFDTSASSARAEISRTATEHIILLSDFSEENPDQILNNLKLDSSYYNQSRRTIFTFFTDAKKNGFAQTMSDYLNWSKMRMDPTDLADVGKYHFLVNGKTAKQNWTGIFRSGERVRLRFINASAMTIFDVSIPGLKMKFVEADGQPIKPTTADEFRIGVAETYDVIVEPKEEKTYTIFAESIDRTGYARGILAPRQGMSGEIPAMRPRAVLTMADMPMEGMDHNTPHPNPLPQGEREFVRVLDGAPSPLEGEGWGEGSGWADAGTPAGKRALHYSDLVSLHPQKDLRQPTREIEFRFGGSMNRYIWTINGEKFPKPIHLKFGERVRLRFINETMMAHPVHLHGMFMQLENASDIRWLPNKHTVLLPPAQTISTLLTANEEGEWAFHCHLLFHMASGMMTSVTVDKAAAKQ